jgi:regulator of replication initiation timing
VPADSRPSYEELSAEVGEFRSIVERLTARLDMLEAENAQLRAENAELKRRLGMNSRNSAKPPSTDSPFAKPAPRLPEFVGLGGREAFPG